jgi:hypothetical protein
MADYNIYEFLTRAIADLKHDLREDLDELRRGREQIMDRLTAIEKRQHEAAGMQRFISHMSHVIAIIFGGAIGTLVSWLKH